MSSMQNHKRRSRRGDQKKRAAFGSMARRNYITPMRPSYTRLGRGGLFRKLRAAARPRTSRSTVIVDEMEPVD